MGIGTAANFCGIEQIVPTPTGPTIVYLPLEQLNVHAEVIDVSAIVTLTQSFWQCSPDATSQAQYVFPLPARAAVCGFEMRTEDGRTIKAVAKERDTARREHEEAIEQGKLTGLVEHVQDDVFTVSLGCLPQLQIITTKLTYVLDLMDDEQVDQVRLQLPVSIGQRYGVIPEGMVGAAVVTPARVKISCEVYMRSSIQSITSPSHPVVAIFDGSTLATGPGLHEQTVQYHSPDFLEQDFVLSIKADGLDAAHCFAETAPDGSIALQITVTPHVKLPPIPSQEYIFLIDRSGSMGGDRIDTAKRALVMLLRALPRKGTSFNIFSFGTTCDSLWKESMPYNEQNLEAATNHVDTMDADYGGTEIRGALEQTFASRCAKLPTSCFLLTDGEAWDTQGTIATVKRAASSANAEAPLRVFTLGIGSTTSTEMCEAISRASGGICLMAVSAESIVGKCSKLVKASRSEILRDVAIKWGVHADDKGKSTDLQRVVLRQGPEVAPLLYDGVRFVAFALVNDPKYVIPPEVVVHTKRVGTGDVFEFSVPVEELKRTSSTTPQRPTIHTLAARRIIMDLEDQERDNVSEHTKAAIIHLGEQYQLASRYTSFVAVDDNDQEKCCTIRRSPATTAGSAVTPARPRGRGGKGLGKSAAKRSVATKSTARKSTGGKAFKASVQRVVTSSRSLAAGSEGHDGGEENVKRARYGEDAVLLLIRQQSFDGSFPINEDVRQILKLKAAEEDAASVGVDAAVWVTVLAVAYLRKHLTDQPELLDALIEKAKEFVQDFGGVTEDFDGLVARAMPRVP